MNTTELRDALSELQHILLLNKEAVPLTLLDQIGEMLEKVQNPTIRVALGTILGDWGVESLITMMVKVVAIEKKLLLHEEGESSLSDKLHASLSNLQHRPLVLMAIAAAL